MLLLTHMGWQKANNRKVLMDLSLKNLHEQTKLVATESRVVFVNAFFKFRHILYKDEQRERRVGI